MSIQIIALYVLAIYKRFVLLDFILQLEMAFEMMKPILLTAAMMVVTAVDRMSIKITALNVNALVERKFNLPGSYIRTLSNPNILCKKVAMYAYNV